MKRAMEYLYDKCVVSKGDIVFIGLKELMEYTKLVELYALLEFIENNNPDSHGLLNDIRFKVREILEASEQEEIKDNPFDE